MRIFRDEPHETTEKSKKFVTQNILKLGSVTQVSMYVEQDKSVFNTWIYGTKGILVTDGFSIGYNGEGPHGFEWLLKLLKIDYDPSRIFGCVEDGYHFFLKKGDKS